MKRNINILCLAAALTLMGSCKDALDAPAQSSLDESIIFSTPALAQGSIAGILQSFGETNSYRGRYLVFYGANTDTEVHSSLKSVNDDRARLTNYNTNVANGQMNTDNNAWAKFYEGIERANMAIRGLRAYGNVQSNPQLAQILGEILTLRAVLYNDLIKGWGDVPARFEPITTATSHLPRSDRDVIYKQLLADLEEAASLLPWPNETSATSSVERVNKAFAKGLRARLALAAGGYSQRADGVIRLSNDPDLSRQKMYEIAKKECLDIIESRSQRLLGFEEVFKTFHRETGVAGLESMWEIPFSEGRGRVIFDLGVRHLETNRYTGQNRGGNVGPNPIMLYEYEPGDVRRDVSIVPYEWTRDASLPGDQGGHQVPGSLSRLYFGKYRYEWLNRRVTSSNDDGLNWMYMRYSDVILMAAEAINELDGPAAAAPYLRMVRERAFPGQADKVNDYMNEVTASPERFFQAIVDERALEFVGEMLRKADLIRWNLLGAKLADAKEKLRMLDKREGKYSNLPERLYYRYKADNETLEFYGLNFGETTVPSGYSDKAWTLSSDSDQVTYWDALYQRDPNAQQYWPIWQYFIENSNGVLNNGGVSYE